MLLLTRPPTQLNKIIEIIDFQHSAEGFSNYIRVRGMWKVYQFINHFTKLRRGWRSTLTSNRNSISLSEERLADELFEQEIFMFSVWNQSNVCYLRAQAFDCAEKRDKGGTNGSVLCKHNSEPFFFLSPAFPSHRCEGGNRKLMLPFMSLINNKKANDVRGSCGLWDAGENETSDATTMSRCCRT